ncbi:MAG: hypothetical protein AAFZ01_14000 [Pseudomonadota bacterium]
MKPDLEMLSDTLDAFGADTSRWPQGRAHALRSAIESDEGQRLCAEARALDDALTLAGATNHTQAGVRKRNAALLDAIMERTEDASLGGSTASGSERHVKRRGRGLRRTEDTQQRSALWRAFAGGALAASLCLGFVSGMTGSGVAVTDGFLAFSNTAEEFGESTDELLADLTYGGLYEFEDDVL